MTTHAVTRPQKPAEYIFSRVDLFPPLVSVVLWFFTILTGLRVLTMLFTGDDTPTIPGLDLHLGVLPGSPMPILGFLLVMLLDGLIMYFSYRALPPGKAKDSFRAMSIPAWYAFIVSYAAFLAMFWMHLPTLTF